IYLNVSGKLVGQTPAPLDSYDQYYLDALYEHGDLRLTKVNLSEDGSIVLVSKGLTVLADSDPLYMRDDHSPAEMNPRQRFWVTAVLKRNEERYYRVVRPEKKSLFGRCSDYLNGSGEK